MSSNLMDATTSRFMMASQPIPRYSEDQSRRSSMGSPSQSRRPSATPSESGTTTPKLADKMISKLVKGSALKAQLQMV